MKRGDHESAGIRKYFYPVIYLLKKNCRFGLFNAGWYIIFNQLITNIDCNRQNTDTVDKDMHAFKCTLFLLCIHI